MDFLISTPFKLSLNIIELDEHLPSMNISFHLDASNMQNELTHVGEIWVETKEYYNFLISLKNKEFIESEFKSIDNDFSVILSKKNTDFVIALNIRKDGLFEKITIQSYIQFKLSEDEYFHAIREFEKLEIYL